jgi:hypothetical protein
VVIVFLVGRFSVGKGCFPVNGKPFSGIEEIGGGFFKNALRRKARPFVLDLHIFYFSHFHLKTVRAKAVAEFGF